MIILCNRNSIRVPLPEKKHKLIKCTAKRILHPITNRPTLCENKKCSYYYKCHCGKTFGTHTNYKPIFKTTLQT